MSLNLDFLDDESRKKLVARNQILAARHQVLSCVQQFGSVAPMGEQLMQTGLCAQQQLSSSAAIFAASNLVAEALHRDAGVRLSRIGDVQVNLSGGLPPPPVFNSAQRYNFASRTRPITATPMLPTSTTSQTSPEVSQQPPSQPTPSPVPHRALQHECDMVRESMFLTRTVGGLIDVANTVLDTMRVNPLDVAVRTGCELTEQTQRGCTSIADCVNRVVTPIVSDYENRRERAASYFENRCGIPREETRQSVDGMVIIGTAIATRLLTRGAAH